jgi:hypothetical protein
LIKRGRRVPAVVVVVESLFLFCGFTGIWRRIAFATSFSGNNNFFCVDVVGVVVLVVAAVVVVFVNLVSVGFSIVVVVVVVVVVGED